MKVKNYLIDHVTEISTVVFTFACVGTGFVWGFLIGRYDQ